MTNAKNTRKSRATVTSAQAAVIAKAKTTPAAAGAPTKTSSKPAAAPTSTAAASVAKPKLVRDSFTIPKSEYVVLEGLKVRAANLTRPVKKSELLRAGVAALSAMTDKAFLAALNAVPSLKTGRPKGADATPPTRKAAK